MASQLQPVDFATSLRNKLGDKAAEFLLVNGVTCFEDIAELTEEDYKDASMGNKAKIRRLQKELRANTQVQLIIKIWPPVYISVTT